MVSVLIAKPLDEEDFDRKYLQTPVILQVPPFEFNPVPSVDEKHVERSRRLHRHEKKSRRPESATPMPTIVDKSTRDVPPNKARSKEQCYVDFLERLIIEASFREQRSRRIPLTNSNNHASRAEKFVSYTEHDEFLRDIVAKMEDMRSKKKTKRLMSSTSRDIDEVIFAGVERIVERRFYVKKSKLKSNQNELTSTTDLTFDPKKIRQLSGESFVSATTSGCSRCSASTPTYVENLRNQSNSVQNELNELRTEIKQLRTTQGQFFQQLTLQLRSSQNSNQPSISLPETKRIESNPAIPLTNSQRVRSISTESQASSSSNPDTVSELDPSDRPISSSMRAPIAPKLPMAIITESIPVLIPAPPIERVLVVTTPAAIPMRPPLPIASPMESERTSIAATPPVGPNPPSRLPSAPTSIAATATIGPNPPSTLPSVRTPIYENVLPGLSIYENVLPNRSIVSPRSQIIASSSSSLKSPNPSLRSSSNSSTTGSILQKSEKPPSADLNASELQELVTYSAQLQRAPAIQNPTLNDPFWGSVDAYLDATKRSNRITGLPPFPRPSSLNKQLDKYDLEIKPQEIIESSAPLLLPPSDVLPSTILIDNGRQIPFAFDANSEVAKLLAWSSRLAP